MSKDNLSRIYREGAWPEPSRQIDQAILAAARRTAREQHPFLRRWAPSFAVAATVVLASAIVLKVVREQPEAVSPSGPDQYTGIRLTRESPVAEPKAAETKPAPAPAAQPAEPPRGFSSTMDTAEAERLDRLRRDLDLKQSAPASESPLAASRPALADKALKKEAELQPRKPDVPLQRTREQKPTAVSVFGASPPASVPAPEPAPAPAAAPPAPRAATGGIGALSASIAKAPERSPQAWIEDIRKLMKEGMSVEAGEELAKFKKRYPDYALPEDLR